MNYLQEGLSLFALQLAIYFIACCLVSLMSSGLLKAGIGQTMDSRPLFPGQVSTEIRWSILTCLIYAVCMWGLFTITPVNSSDSNAIILLKFVAFLIFYDFCIYLIHRGLHSSHLIRFHSRHHRSVRVTPFSALSLHPVEALLNQVPYFMFFAFVPLSHPVIIAFYCWLMVGTAIGHSNYNPFGNFSETNFFSRYSRFHQLHHQKPKGNYGFVGNHWDVVFGTQH